MAEDTSPQDHRLAAVADGPNTWLTVELLDDIQPFESGGFVASGKVMPDGLDGILFDPADHPGGPRQTYAILDAAVYSLLPEILEASELPHKCLFTGQALADNADAAPWLVALEPDNKLTRNLLSTSAVPGGLWDMDLGLFVKSRLSFDALWTHCRKFTRIEDDEGNWLFYRYWSPPVSTRVMALGNRPELIQFVGPHFPTSDPDLEMLLLNTDLCARLSRIPGTKPPALRPILTAAAHETIREVRMVLQFNELVEIAVEHTSDKTEMSEKDLRTVLRLQREPLFQAGFWQRDHLVKMMVWEVLLGPNFVASYANGQIRDIVMEASAPYEAIMKIELLLETQEAERREAEEATKGIHQRDGES